MKRFFVMELGHADIYGGFKTLPEAREALARICAVTDPFRERGDDEFGIIECDAEGHLVGEVIKL